MKDIQNKLCLIGGTGRSGTSILRRIFSRHPDMSDIPEWRFLIDPDGIIDFYTTCCQTWSPYHYDLKIKRLERLLKDIANPSYRAKLSRFPRKMGFFDKLSWKIFPRYTGIHATDYCPEFDTIAKQLIESLTEFKYSGSWTGMQALEKKELVYHSIFPPKKLAEILGRFLSQVIESVLTHQSVSYYLEKNTWNILWFDKILDLLPETRMVHIYRDPRDVVASYVTQTWMPSEPVQSAKIYKDVMERWWHIKQKIDNNSFLEIALESLVAEPEAILRQICTFWKIPWHDSLLKTDLSKSNSGRWKKEMTSVEQNEVASILLPLIETLGYE